MGRQGNFLDRINMIKRIQKVAVAGPATVLFGWPGLLRCPGAQSAQEARVRVPVTFYSWLKDLRWAIESNQPTHRSNLPLSFWSQIFLLDQHCPQPSQEAHLFHNFLM